MKGTLANAGGCQPAPLPCLLLGAQSHKANVQPAEVMRLTRGSRSVLGDTWLLRPRTHRAAPSAEGGCEWAELVTSGATAKRAHHSGGLVGGNTLLVFSGQDETLITQHTLCSLDLTTATWSSVALPTDGPCWSTRRQVRPSHQLLPATPPNCSLPTKRVGPRAWQANSGSHCGAPIARIDGAGAVVRGVGLVIFGGVGDDFGFVPAADAWLLRTHDDVRPQRRLALPTKALSVEATSAPPDVGPCARACLGLCADGLSLHLFGGFDGECDLSDLWTLDLQRTTTRSSLRPAATSTFDIDAFKARQARASAVLHGTQAASVHTSSAGTLHLRVGLAARDPPSCVEGQGSSADCGTLPMIESTPATTTADVEYNLGTGLGDGLSRGQRAAVLAAFRD